MMMLFRFFFTSFTLWCICSSFSLPKEDQNSNKLTESLSNVSPVISEGRSTFSDTKNILIAATSSLLELVALVGNSITPYIDLSFLDWRSLGDHLSNLKTALSRVDSSSNPLAVLAVATGALTGPYIYQIIKAIVYGIYQFLDNIYFAVTGYAIGRSIISEEVLQDLLRATVNNIN